MEIRKDFRGHEGSLAVQIKVLIAYGPSNIKLGSDNVALRGEDDGCCTGFDFFTDLQ